MKDYKTGEWVASGNAVHQMHSRHYGECVCICHGVNRDVNARLFAAAPDLLEACEILMEHIKEGLVSVYEEKADNGQPGVSACEMIEAAIKKARGEQ